MLVLGIISLCILLIWVKITGDLIIQITKFQLEKSINFFISPLVGLSILVGISSIYGWIIGFNGIIFKILFYFTLFVNFILLKTKKKTLFELKELIAFSLIASLPIFATAIKFDAFNPFNDAFTYLVHAQWLQVHPFFEKVIPSGNFPALTQIFLYQNMGSRMGASFVLASVQSIFGFNWSYYAYLPTQALAFVIGCFTGAGIISAFCPNEKRKLIYFFTLILVFSSNGFNFGSQYGFLPQTFGLCFVIGLVYIYPIFIAQSCNKNYLVLKELILELIPIALIISALLLCYNDLIAVIATPFLIYIVLLKIQYKIKINKLLLINFSLLLIVILILNYEFLRIFKNFIGVINAAGGTVQIGWPVNWLPIQFLSATFGLKLPFDKNFSGFDYILSTYGFSILIIILILIFYKYWKNNILNEKVKSILKLILIINVIFVFLFINFRYLVPNISETELGNTFLQYKLSKWISPINICVLGGLLCLFYTRLNNFYKKLLIIFTSFSLMIGFIFQLNILPKYQTTHFLTETNLMKSSFNLFLKLRESVEKIPKDDVIYLDIPSEHHKISQMIAYILYDRKLAGKYYDGYIRGSLPEHDREMNISDAKWSIRYLNYLDKSDNKIGPFELHKYPFNYVNNTIIKNKFNVERDGKNYWYWVNDEILFSFNSNKKNNIFKIQFDTLLNGKERKLKIEIFDSKNILIDTVEYELNSGWHKFISKTFFINDKFFSIKISADGINNKISLNDNREAKFLIRNLFLDLNEKDK